MKNKKQKEEVKVIFKEGDIVDLYFYGALFKASTPIVKVMDYGNGLVRYQVLDFLVTSNNLKKSEK
jgi:hypothetical protein